MKHRLLYLIRFLAIMIIVFMAMKVVFMFYNTEEGNFSGADVFRVLLDGLPLDLATALYLLILPWAVCVASVWIAGHWAQRVLKVYIWIIAVLTALILVGDCALYEFWQFKLDATIFNYITSPWSVVSSVSWLYVCVGALCVIMLAVLIALSLLLITRRTPPPCRHKWKTTTGLIALAPFMFLGIRGGVGRSTMNVGSVYFSQNQFLNHAAVNPAFSLLASTGKVMDFAQLYRFMPQQRADSLFLSLHYNTESINTPPLLRAKRPNVVLFVLEGFGANFIEALGGGLAPAGNDKGGKAAVTPNFNRLCREGVLFTQCYANSFRTDRGLISALSGYPAFPDFSIMKIPEKSRSLPSIAASLKAEGYSTYYLYGGDINFTNQKSYLLSTGYQRAEGDLSFPLRIRRTHSWGVADHILLDTLCHRLTRRPPHKPFFITVQTLSSHENWRVPFHRFPNDKKANAVAYVDHYIGKLVGQLKNSRLWDNLLLVFIADHGIAYPEGLTEASVTKAHIPLLMVGGALNPSAGGMRVSSVCNQSDLPAILLGRMEIPHGQFRFSRDVLSLSYTRPCALHTFSNGFSFIDSGGYTVYDLSSGRIISSGGSNPASRLRLGQALLQTQIADFERK